MGTRRSDSGSVSLLTAQLRKAVLPGRLLLMNSLTRRLLALSVAGAVTVGVGAAVAQNADKPAKPEGRAAQREAHKARFQALNLTEEQKAKLKELHQKARERRKEIQSSTATAEEKKQRLGQVRKEQHEAFQQML